MKRKESKEPVPSEESPFDTPPDKKSHGKLVLILVVFFVILPVLFVGVIVFIVFAMLSKSTYEIDNFFSKIDEGDYAGAHGMLIDNYQRNITVDAFRDVMGDFDGCSARVFSMDMSNGDKTASGELRCDSGTYDLNFGFLKREREYRLYMINVDGEDLLLQMVAESN